MEDEYTVEFLLDVARQTVEAAGTASLVTLDENGAPSSRSIAAFAPDDDFARFVIGSNLESRKVDHIERDPRVLLTYLDGANRGYLTVVAKAYIERDAAERTTYWVDRFSAFFPGGPESDEYQLMIVVPERLELRSFGLKVADKPTRWSPVMLERDNAGAWAQTN
jgi:general stress protein 26